MGAIDKLLKAINMNTDVDDYGYDEYEDDYEDIPDTKSPSKDNKESLDEKPKKASKVAAFSNSKKRGSNNFEMEIKSIKPQKFEDSSLIADELLIGNAVIINVTNVDVNVAKRILDFSFGSIYAIRGTLKKVTDSIFVAVPSGVNIDGAFDDKAED